MRALLLVPVIACSQQSSIWFAVARRHGGQQLRLGVPEFRPLFAQMTIGGDEPSTTAAGSEDANYDLSCLHSSNVGSKAATIGDPLPTGSAKQCALVCREVTECNHFTYNTQAKMCYLKSGKPDLYSYPGDMTAPRSCDTTCFEKGVSYDKAPDVMNPISASQAVDCQAACAADPRCKTFTFSEPDKTCSFKGRGFSAHKQMKVAGVTSGPAQFCDSGGDLRLQEQADQLYGCVHTEDVGSEAPNLSDPKPATSMEACMKRCRSEGKCTHFTFNVTAGMCHLKAGKMQLYPYAGDRTGPKSCDTSCFWREVAYAKNQLSDLGSAYQILQPTDCQALCAANPLCKVFVWDYFEKTCAFRGKGFLKHKKPHAVGAISGPREFCDFGGNMHQREEADAANTDDPVDAARALPNAADHHQDLLCVHTGNIGSKAGDIESPQPANDLTECMARCKATKKCSHYTFNTNSKYCHMKSGKPKLYEYPGDLTGSKTCDTSCFRRGVDYSTAPGVGKPWFTTLATDCQVACGAEDGCVAFTWHAPTSRCYLLTAGFSKHRRDGVEGAISGPYTFCDDSENLQVLEEEDA
uniref:Microneme protein 4 n=1 Tax=Neospora caninum TaxID=29176 RepID=Q2KHJ3_NEOCA|nr:TPA_exp: microneme protein 4 [Neospora caninum]